MKKIDDMISKHEIPFGAQCREDGTVRFKLWAPKANKVDLCLDANVRIPMLAEDGGWFGLTTNAAAMGSRYQYAINDLKVPDPGSRFQPEDVHGPSEVIDPASFDWRDSSWRGRPWEEAVIYELHVGTFSSEGTFAGVESKLNYLAEIGISAIELMPLSDFYGKRNWGYDGVLPYAPDSAYGRPEDLKRLIQAAHAKGLMVILDVVYNHFGPDGNYLNAYSPQFFTERHQTPWGAGINFDGAQSRVVRDFFIHNALYWLEEYHFDGLRFDAIHAIMDDSMPDILEELAETVRSSFGRDRHVHLILENGDNEEHYLRASGDVFADIQRGSGYDAQWNDDIHHALHVLITGEMDGYYSDYKREPVYYLGRCLTEGFAYQGEFSEHQKISRGEPSAHLSPLRFVNFLQNHDQIGNRAMGERIGELASDDALRAAVAILLLAPSPPLLFMGEEFKADTPFLFFCDFSGDLAKAVTDGRRSEFASFAKFSLPEMQSQIPDPNSEETFQRSKLNWESLNKENHLNWLNFYRELLLIRSRSIVPHLKQAQGNSGSFDVVGTNTLRVTWTLKGGPLHLIANLGSKSSVEVSRPGGEILYSNGPDVSSADINLQPWQVAWFLER